jgi:hypothetical protein
MKEALNSHFKLFSKLYQNYLIVTLVFIVIMGLIFRDNFGVNNDILLMFDVVFVVIFMFVSIWILNFFILRNGLLIEEIKEIKKYKTMAMINIMMPNIVILVLPLLYSLTFLFDAGSWYIVPIMGILFILFGIMVLLTMFVHYFSFIFRLKYIKPILVWKLVGSVGGWFVLFLGGHYILEEVIVLPQNNVFWYNFFLRFNNYILPIALVCIVLLAFIWLSELYEEVGEA